jgi:U6 snRNA-associated Sm-like protein LSm4
MVELKSGDSYNGTLLAIDHLMNLHLRDVTWTSADGQKFWKARILLLPSFT